MVVLACVAAVSHGHDDDEVEIKVVEVCWMLVADESRGECWVISFSYFLSDSDHEATVIPTVLLVSPEAEATVVASPVDVLDWVIHSDIETDPSEDPSSLDHAPIIATHVIPAPFIEATIAPSDVPSLPIHDTTNPVAEVLPVPHVARRRTRMIARKRVKGYKHVLTPTRSDALRL
nr:hypothetical protein [Tanacetum cinerariifolium]